MVKTNIILQFYCHLEINLLHEQCLPDDKACRDIKKKLNLVLVPQILEAQQNIHESSPKASFMIIICVNQKQNRCSSTSLVEMETSLIIYLIH